jgi:diadenosine tetraphosphate (Ap4A) HIT family hydrolase
LLHLRTRRWNPDYPHHVVARDALTVVSLAKYPWLRGHMIVAPVQHREQVVLDFGEDEYVRLQKTLHRAGRALQEVVETERLYVLSLGSQQGNRHTHWHLVPLPPGVPYREQQLAALDQGRGWLDLPAGETTSLAADIRDAMQRT